MCEHEIFGMTLFTFLVQIKTFFCKNFNSKLHFTLQNETILTIGDVSNVSNRRRAIK